MDLGFRPESSLQLIGGAVMAAAALFCLLSRSGPRSILAGSLLAASSSGVFLLCLSRLSSGTRAADALAFFIVLCSVCTALLCWAAATPGARGAETGSDDEGKGSKEP